MKNVLKSLAKIVLIPLELTATASSTDAAIHQQMFRSGVTPLIISNEEINDNIKIVKSIEEFSLLIKGISKKTFKMFRTLLGTLGATLLGNVITGKGTIRAGKGMIRAGQDF